MSEYPPTVDTEFQKLVRAKYAGNPRAITALAVRLMVGRDTPFSPVDGLALLSEAARQDDGEAWSYLALMAAAGVGRAQSWPDAFEALAQAVKLEYKAAVRQRQLLTTAGIVGAHDVDSWLAAPAVQDARVLHTTPRFAAHRGLLPLVLCKYLIEQSRPRLIPAQVFDAHSGTLKADRKSVV